MGSHEFGVLLFQCGHGFSVGSHEYGVWPFLCTHGFSVSIHEFGVLLVPVVGRSAHQPKPKPDKQTLSGPDTAGNP